MSIKDRLDEEQQRAEAWVPGTNDELIGRIVSISTRTSGGYDPYPIYTVKPEDGDALAFHAYHTVAQNLLNEVEPRVGDEIGIRYLGKVTPDGGGNPYHSYRIVIERAGEGTRP